MTASPPVIAEMSSLCMKKIMNVVFVAYTSEKQSNYLVQTKQEQTDCVQKGWGSI